MDAIRLVASMVDLAATLLVVAVGAVCLGIGDRHWWLLPAGLIYLLTFGSAGRALWRWLATSG
jgi:hypothetical protein